MNKKAKTQLTAEGLEKLKEELAYRKNVKKKELSEMLGNATEKGDLSENDEYNIVLEDILANDLRISELTDIVKNVEVVKNDNNSQVHIGSKVKVKDGNGKEKMAQIVGETEANPLENKYSHTSPIGKGLMGKAVGESVDIQTPRGTTNYTILSIE